MSYTLTVVASTRDVENGVIHFFFFWEGGRGEEWVGKGGWGGGGGKTGATLKHVTKGSLGIFHHEIYIFQRLILMQFNVTL